MQKDIKLPMSRCAGDNLRGQKSLGPLKMSLEMAHKIIVPQKKNYVPQFLKQRDINSYLKVHKNENFFAFDFEFCTISLLVMHK